VTPCALYPNTLVQTSKLPIHTVGMQATLPSEISLALISCPLSWSNRK